MSASVLFTAAMLSVANAYTVIQAMGPYMHKNIDPIVFPGSYNESHLHTFYGSDALTVDTKTSAELQAGCTNFENPNDLSSYWVPTVLYTTDSGRTYQPVPVFRFSAYYNLGESPAEIPIPQNLAVIAGKGKATSAAEMDPNAMGEFLCADEPSGNLDANGFPKRTCKTFMHQLLYFPSCVNEKTLETAYKSTNYGTANRCPAGMKRMPQLRFSIRYDLRKVLPNGWNGQAPFKLSCGPAWCNHGDFINGWTVDAARNMVATSQDKRKFLPVNGSRGPAKAGVKCVGKDRVPNKGTNNYGVSLKMMGKAKRAVEERVVEAVGWVSKSRFARE